jgi:hypothetical protein
MGLQLYIGICTLGAAGLLMGLKSTELRREFTAVDTLNKWNSDLTRVLFLRFCLLHCSQCSLITNANWQSHYTNQIAQRGKTFLLIFF